MEKTGLSRYLSLILRHKPGAAGIRLDAHGWADVGELVAGVAKTYAFDREMLEEIVKTDPKQRYSFNSDRTKIRANQGHSIPVDVGLEAEEPPEFLWHGTGKKYTEAIEAEGLKAKSRLYVHLSKDPDTARDVGRRHGEPVLYRVAAGKMKEDGFTFYQSENGVWLTEHVPAGYLQRRYRIEVARGPETIGFEITAPGHSLDDVLDALEDTHQEFSGRDRKSVV